MSIMGESRYTSCANAAFRVRIMPQLDKLPRVANHRRDHPVQPILLFGERHPRLRHSHVTTKGRALSPFGKLAAVFCVVSVNV
jgi:hypothetical protein